MGWICTLMITRGEGGVKADDFAIASRNEV